jgi:large subunit ribosomal protein L33
MTATAAATAYWSSMPRDNIILQCTECKERNYVTTKNKKNQPNRLEFKKFCRRCRKHQLHRENK